MANFESSISFLADLTMGAYFSWKNCKDHNWREWAQTWNESDARVWILANYPEFGPDAADEAEKEFAKHPSMTRQELIAWIIDYLEYGREVEPPTFDEALYASLYTSPYINV